MKSSINFLLAASFCSLYFIACKQKENTVDTKEKVCVSDSIAKMITIDTAKESNISDELSLSGEVSFNENKVVKVFPFASGQVQEVKVSLGDKVSKGQTLAIIKSADVAGNYSDLTGTEADLSIAKRQLEQASNLYKSGISSEKEYTEAKENYNKSLAVNKKIKAQIAINGGGNTSATGIYIIRAPQGGYIVEKNINAGAFIRSDASANLFTISDMKDVWIWANVFESDISKIKKEFTADVTTLAYPNKTFKGKIDQISEVLDPDNKVMKVKIVLPNEDMLLKPEMYTNVLILNTESSKSVTIPASALVFDGGKNYVIVYHDKCNLEIREVSVIKTVNNISFLRSGLKSGERIISKNEVLLYNALIEE
jgi:cobalt-zinc-cadmium efflux system membrane fusion protein